MASDPFSLIGGILGFGSSAMNVQAQRDVARENREWQEKMINQARDWELEQWHMQNEYNAPQAQMQRYNDAGLNPNLIYSQGTPGIAGQLSTTAPSSNQVAPQFDPSPMLQAAQIANQRKQTDSNVRLQDSQIAVQRQQVHNMTLQAVTEIARARNIDEQTKGQIIQNLVSDATKDTAIEQAQLNVDIARWQTKIQSMSYEEKKYQVEKYLPLSALKMQIEMTAIASGIQLNQAQIGKLAVETQNAAITGDIQQLEKDWIVMQRGSGIAPTAPGWFQTIANGGFWHNIVGPVWQTATSGYRSDSELGIGNNSTPPVWNAQPGYDKRPTVDQRRNRFQRMSTQQRRRARFTR